METADVLKNVVFYVFALVAAGGAVSVALSKNIVRSAFSLLAVLFSAAALYALMMADFLMAAQILIYVGGILILIVFAVMLTHRITDVRVSNESTPTPVAALAALAVFFVLAGLIVSYQGWKTVDLNEDALNAKHEKVAAQILEDIRNAPPAGHPAEAEEFKPRSLTETLAAGMMTKYLLAFEVISLLLLAALIGAAFLARKEVRGPEKEKKT